MVQYVCATGDRWAQVIGRYVPVLHPAIHFQQGAVERLDRCRLGKIDAWRAGRGCKEMARQIRHGSRQRGKVVALVVAVARMEAGLGRRLVLCRIGHSAEYDQKSVGAGLKCNIGVQAGNGLRR